MIVKESKYVFYLQRGFIYMYVLCMYVGALVDNTKISIRNKHAIDEHAIDEHAIDKHAIDNHASTSSSFRKKYTSTGM